MVEVVYMMLELCEARLLTPYFGDSNVVWTSVISVLLIGSAAGNYLGGIKAEKDKDSIRRWLFGVVLFVSIWLSCLFFVSSYVFTFIVKISYDILGALLASIVLFLPVSVLLSTIPPIVMKSMVDSDGTSGHVIGSTQAYMTVGGILGTLLGGFVFIPYIYLYQTIYILPIILLISYLVWVHFSKGRFIISFVIIFLDVCLIYLMSSLSYVSSVNLISNTDAVSGGGVASDAVYEVDSNYGHIRIVDDSKSGIRKMLISGGYSSAMYLDEDKYEVPVFDYIKSYDVLYSLPGKHDNVCMFGGAAYQYPKHFVATQSGHIDVVEIDSTVTDLAKKYFFLDDIIAKYDAKDRIGLCNADARVFINDCKSKYDAILNDTYMGDVPVKSLTTVEAFSNIKSALNDGGYFMSNVISSIEGDNSILLKSIMLTLSKVFKNVKVVYVPSEDEPELKSKMNARNYLVVASDSDLSSLDSVDVDFSDGILLTDDYCPVDTIAIRLS